MAHAGALSTKLQEHLRSFDIPGNHVNLVAVAAEEVVAALGRVAASGALGCGSGGLWDIANLCSGRLIRQKLIKSLELWHG